MNLLHQKRMNPETGEPCSLTEWIRCAAPWGYATCFAAMRDIEALSDVPAKDLAQITQANIGILRQLSTAVRAQPEVLSAAKEKRSDEFIRHIKQNHADQHIESHKTLRFVADETQEAEIEEAIAMALERGAMNRTEALLAICLDYRASITFDEIVKDLK